MLAACSAEFWTSEASAIPSPAKLVALAMAVLNADCTLDGADDSAASAAGASLPINVKRLSSVLWADAKLPDSIADSIAAAMWDEPAWSSRKVHTLPPGTNASLVVLVLWVLCVVCLCFVLWCDLAEAKDAGARARAIARASIVTIERCRRIC